MTAGIRAACVRCGQDRLIKARSLCESCYMQVKATGKMGELYPTKKERRAAVPNHCGCLAPIPEPLHVWNAVQCMRCGRPII